MENNKGGKMKRMLIVVPTIVIVALNSCSLRRSEPLKGTFVAKNSIVARGEIMFHLHCQKCHPAGEAGLGPNLNWTPAPSFVNRFQVRHGLGTMPSFRQDEIAKADVKAIAKYMKAFKKDKRHD